jgi:hypothetical protein
VFDAGPLLADLVTGPGRGPRDRRSKRRVLAAVAGGALIVLASGAVAVALVRDNGDSTTAAPSTAAPATEPPTTRTTGTTSPPTTVTTSPPTTAVPTTVAPPPPPTQPPADRPTVAIAGPSTIEDNVRYTWSSSSTNATSGQWSLTGGPAIRLTGTGWTPGTGFQMTAGCNAVGATYRLGLTVSGPDGDATTSISFNVVDRNGSC